MDREKRPDADEAGLGFQERLLAFKRQSEDSYQAYEQEWREMERQLAQEAATHRGTQDPDPDGVDAGVPDAPAAPRRTRKRFTLDQIKHAVHGVVLAG